MTERPCVSEIGFPLGCLLERFRNDTDHVDTAPPTFPSAERLMQVLQEHVSSTAPNGRHDLPFHGLPAGARVLF